MKRLAFLLPLATLSGCAGYAGYKAKGTGAAMSVGYSDERLADGVYGVSYQGGGGGWSLERDTAELVVEYLQQRAAELCLTDGHEQYAIDNLEVVQNQIGIDPRLTYPLATATVYCGVSEPPAGPVADDDVALE